MLQHRARDQIYKRSVGFLFVATLIALLMFLRVMDQKSTAMKDTYFVQATAHRVDGLEVDSKVTAAGLRIGKVRSITLAADRQLLVRLELDSSLRNLLREDSVAFLNKPMIGSAIVDISLGTQSKPQLADGATIRMTNPSDVNDIVASVPGKLAKLDAVLEQVLGLVTDLRTDTHQLIGAAAPLKSTMLNVQTASQSTATAVNSLNATLVEAQTLLKTTGSAIKEAEGAVQEIRGGTARIGPVMDRLEATLKNTQTMSTDLLSVTPMVAPALQAGQSAILDADDVLNAAKRNVLLNGGSSVQPLAPVLIAPRAP